MLILIYGRKEIGEGKSRIIDTVIQIDEKWKSN